MKYNSLRIQKDSNFPVSKMWIVVVLITVLAMVLRVITGSL